MKKPFLSTMLVTCGWIPMVTLLAFAGVSSGQTLTEVGGVPPKPGPNDIYCIKLFDDGLNYYDNNSAPPGQTFTTGNNAGGYTLTSLAVKTAGHGGSGETSSQTYTLNIYSVSGTGATNATFITSYTGALTLIQSNWIEWSGLSVPLNPNTTYAYTINDGTSAYEEMSDQTNLPYAGGQICLIPPGGGAITYGFSGAYDAAFDAGLALGSVSGGTVVLNQSTTPPTPGANDIYQLTSTPSGSAVPAQNDDGLNYYDNNNPPMGQTFTTLPSSVGWMMTNLVIGTAGGGGGGETGSQSYHLRIYSLSGTTASLVTTITATGTINNGNDWIQWSGLSVPLQGNATYAYTLQDSTGYEHLWDYSGHPYAGGSICDVPTSGGTVSYGTGSAATNSDAGFDVGLAIPQTPIATAPTYSPNVNPVYAGSVLTLSEIAGGPGPLYYEWLTDNGTGGAVNNPVSGFSTNNTLSVNTSGFNPTNYNYLVIITNVFGAVTSSVVTLDMTNASAPFFNAIITYFGNTNIVTNSMISPSPQTVTNFVGQTQTFTVSAAGTLPINYQWQVAVDANGDSAADISGATNATLTLANLQLTNSGYYNVTLSSSVAPSTNASWTQLVVLPDTNEFYTWSAPIPFAGLTAGQILTNTSGNFLEAEAFNETTNVLFVIINGLQYVFDCTGISATAANYSSSATGMWIGHYTTGNSNLDTIFDSCVRNPTQAGYIAITLKNLIPGQQYSVQLFPVDNADQGRLDYFSDPNNYADASATITLSQNEYIIGTFTADNTNAVIDQNCINIAGYNGNIGAVIVRALSYSPTNPPGIVTQPASVTAYTGRTVQFTAQATGLPFPGYYWVAGPVGGPYTQLTDGGNISGSATTTLMISNVSTNFEVEFVATNSAGTATSTPADLTILSAPPLSGPYSTNVLALNPVAYWPLDETLDPYNNGVGGVSIFDASGNMHDGLYGYNAENGFDGVVGPQPAEGYPQFAVGQGALDILSAFTNSWAWTPALNLNTNTVTFMMWLDPNGPQNPATGLMVNRNSGTVAGVAYDATSGTKLGYIWNNNDSATWSYTNGPVIPSNMWSFVAVEITPNNAQFYVINTNGYSATTFTHTHTNLTWNGSMSSIYLGSDVYSSRTFNGILDEPAVFNYALSPAQLVALTGLNVVIVNTNAATAGFGFKVTGTAGSQTLNFSWAPDHIGWELYTNSAGLTAPNGWFPWPGSASVTNESITINPAQRNVFFQLRYP